MAAMTNPQAISETRPRRRGALVGSTIAGARSNKGAARAASVETTAPFVPPAGRCNVTAIRRAMRRVSQIYDEALALSGLRSTQRSLLVGIARAGRLTMSELAASLVLDRSALAH